MHDDETLVGTSNNARNCDDGNNNKNASSGGMYDRDEDFCYHLLDGSAKEDMDDKEEFGWEVICWKLLQNQK
jgi:hypothetical protein